jgi:hypothetical protein
MLVKKIAVNRHIFLPFFSIIEIDEMKWGMGHGSVLDLFIK